LDNSTYYYLANTPWVDDVKGGPGVYGLSLLGEFAANIEASMNPVCASNVLSLVCHSWFKDCAQVEDQSSGAQMWVPSLLCRSECEKYWETWTACLSSLEADSGAKSSFDTQMQALSDAVNLAASIIFKDEHYAKVAKDTLSPFRLLECDAPGGDPDKNWGEESAIAWVLGQWSARDSAGSWTNKWNAVSLYFPTNMDTSFLYPVTSSVYTHDDGTNFDVPCFVPGEAKEIPKIQCPFPFVNPLAVDHISSCIQPCPSQAYTDAEYTLMWMISGGIGLAGMFLNLFMAFTWMIGGKKYFSDQPYQLKFCVFAGLLFAAVETLPSLALKYDLPCGCETEEWCDAVSYLLNFLPQLMFAFLFLLLFHHSFTGF
jgi:hypothetical protein